ncbi:hypothetical protein ACH5RR_033718 [Cinchona calisaya]|uniref:Uncharacterized protein n=1 Tax=Cinchona calisaya TaxID=153742 RepID=A0ABD2Y8U2_9GENT
MLVDGSISPMRISPDKENDQKLKSINDAPIASKIKKDQQWQPKAILTHADITKIQDIGKTLGLSSKEKESLPLLEKPTSSMFVNIDAQDSLMVDNCGLVNKVDGSKSIAPDGLGITDRIVAIEQKDPKNTSSFGTNNAVDNA